jgi:TonB family protein
MNIRDDLITRQNNDPATNDCASRLVRHAARHNPASLAERLEEEWLADLETRTGAWSRLRFALGCYRATLVIAGNPVAHGASIMRTAHAPAAVAVVTNLPARAPRELSNRTLAMMMIAGLHIALIYAFSMGLISTSSEQSFDGSRGFIINPPRPIAPVPPVPTPGGVVYKPSPPRVDDGFTTIGPITLPPDAVTDSTESLGWRPTEAPAVKRVLGGPGAGFPSTSEFYPPLSRAQGETGTADVQVCVDGGGRLTGDPTLQRSSGSARLDQGALALARAGSGHYRSTTENGQPITSCFPFRIRFAMTR